MDLPPQNIMSPGKVCCLRGVGIYKKSPVGRCCLTGLVGGGGYLLFHFRSIIGVVRFNFSVRNGKRWSPHAIATLVLFSVGFVLPHGSGPPYKVGKSGGS